jgi:hypothetical protein
MVTYYRQQDKMSIKVQLLGGEKQWAGGDAFHELRQEVWLLKDLDNLESFKALKRESCILWMIDQMLCSCRGWQSFLSYRAQGLNRFSKSLYPIDAKAPVAQMSGSQE